MAGTFAEWLRRPDRTCVVLAEFDPTLEVSGWTAVGVSAPHTYCASLARVCQQSLLPGGLTRRCVGVKQNATSLTEQEDVDEVDANPGSWYWDEEAETLYVHTTTGSDPDLFTVMQAVVRFYIATHPVVLNRIDDDPDTGIYYQPWLDGVLPTIVTEVEDMFFGQKLLATTGNVQLLNATGIFDTLVAPDGLYHWKNKSVRFYVGGSYNGLSLPRSEYVAVTTMQVEDVSADEQHAVFELKPRARRLTIDVPRTPYFEGEYLNLGDGVRGTRKWIGYGRAIMRPDLTDTTEDYGQWTVADANYQTLFAVHQVWAESRATGARTLLTLTTHYTVNLTDCTITVVHADYAWQTHALVVDVTGKPDGAGSYLKTFGAIVVDLLTNVAGVDISDVDTAAFATCDAEAPEELAVWLKSPRQLSSLLATSEDGLPCLERSVMGTVQETVAGKFTGWIWSPGYDAATVTTLSKSDFVRFRPQPRLETVVDTVRVAYNRDLASGAWALEEEASPKVAYVNDTDYALEIFTFLRNSADAQTLAQRYELIAGAVPVEVDFELRVPLLLQHRVGDKVLVTFDRAPAAAGEYIERPFELVRLGKSFAPTVAIVGRLGDLRGIGAKIAHVTDDSAPDWASTPDAERVGRGYVADDNGRVVSLDPTTENIRLIW